MKRILISGFALLLCITTGCSKKDSGITQSGSMEVIKDCTGAYLRYGGKDYKVCNVDKLGSYENGQFVNAAFGRLASCKAEDEKIICMMAHMHEGYVQVAYIRQ